MSPIDPQINVPVRIFLVLVSAAATSTPGAGILSPQIAFQEAVDLVWYGGGAFSPWCPSPRHSRWRQRVDIDRPTC